MPWSKNDYCTVYDDFFFATVDTYNDVMETFLHQAASNVLNCSDG